MIVIGILAIGIGAMLLYGLYRCAQIYGLQWPWERTTFINGWPRARWHIVWRGFLR